MGAHQFNRKCIQLGDLMGATDIPVLLTSPWYKAYKKIETQIQCELLSHTTISNIATKFLERTYHFLLRYALLL